MAKTAAERQTALQPHVQAARQQVADLQARIAQLAEWAKGHYTNGDTENGDLSHAEMAKVRGELDAAQERLTTLVEAEQVVSREHQADLYREQLSGVQAALQEAIDERDRHLAEIRPTVQAAKAAIRSARAAEDQAKRHDLDRMFLLDAIAGLPQQVHRSTVGGRVDGLIGRDELLVTLERASNFR